jgi:Spy/CpxP family protein refolding chaperone
MNRRILCIATLAVAAFTVGGAALAQGPGGGRRGGPGGFGGFGGGPMGLLMMPEVQQELKLQQAQIDLLQGLRQQRGGPGGGGQGGPDFRNMSPEERERFFAARQQEQRKQIGEILDANQMKRLRQLEIQREGARALNRPDVADELKLTQAQRQQVRTALDGEREAMRQAFAGFQPGGEPPSQEQRQQAFQRMQDTRTATDAKLNAVLTAPQKTQFQQMKGAAFQFPQPRFGPGGPGGPGGRGRRPQ